MLQPKLILYSALASGWFSRKKNILKYIKKERKYNSRVLLLRIDRLKMGQILFNPTVFIVRFKVWFGFEK
jgi:hypothetical protein